MLLNQIADLIRQSMGMDAGTLGRSSLANAVRVRMTARGTAELPHYWEQLRESGGELDQLMELVVVPETWFFRAPEAFAALIRLIRQEWMPSHPGGRLHILSAPCSTGEEPYSIAMTLLDAGLSPDRFRIDAVDISHRALAQARRAVYGRNSFRGNDLSFRDRYFSEVPGGYQLHSAVRECVGFRQGNLVAAEALSGMDGRDVIFCRNVLIYFDTATQERVILTLARRLAPEGLLFVGPAETFVARAAGFRVLDFPGAFVCRGTGVGNPPPPSLPPSFIPWSPAPGDSTKRAVSKTKQAASKMPPDPGTGRFFNPVPAPVLVPTPPSAPPAIVLSAPPGNNRLEAATRLANAGQLPEALSMAEAYLREYDSSADAYCLLGLIRDAMGDAREAEKLYRRALYLEPAHHGALPHLALLVEKQGDPEGARRLRVRAQRGGEALSR
ncbi:MAG: CheR family methyltransferase [Verrucomicrobiota bacterium]